MTWAPFLERLGGVLDDLPTRLALAGAAGCLAVTVGLLRWASQHYVSSVATDWRLTTWKKADLLSQRRSFARGRESACDIDAMVGSGDDEE